MPLALLFNPAPQTRNPQGLSSFTIYLHRSAAAFCFLCCFICGFPLPPAVFWMVLYSIGNSGILFSCLHAASQCIHLITSARGAVQDQHPAPKAMLPFLVCHSANSTATVSHPFVPTALLLPSCADSSSAFVAPKLPPPALSWWLSRWYQVLVANPWVAWPATPTAVDSFCKVFPAKWGCQMEFLGSTKMGLRCFFDVHMSFRSSVFASVLFA